MTRQASKTLLSSAVSCSEVYRFLQEVFAYAEAFGLSLRILCRPSGTHAARRLLADSP